MGCASSKPKRCRHCKTPYSPMPRTYSMHVHHPAQGKGDSYHVVALTSSTLGSMMHDSPHNNNIGDHFIVKGQHTNNNNDEEDNKTKQFSMGLIEAKTWSTMIEEKIPKVKIVPRTPIMTPPGEPETINAWELMEGLEEFSPYHSPSHIRSFSFDFVNETEHVVPSDRRKSMFLESNNRVSPQPMWLQVSADDDFSTKSIEFDPEIIATFRKSLEDLPPNTPILLQPLDEEKQTSMVDNGNDIEKTNVNDLSSDFKFGKDDKVVVYFTSLRGVRKTYEDCCHVRVILKSLGIRVDERDVSMHSGFKEELKEQLLAAEVKGGLGLPKIFVGKKCIGGAEEIRRMHEEGQLEKLLQPFKIYDYGNCGNNAVACQACGDITFVPCETCSGSCKVYYECDEEEDCEDGDFGFQRCLECNENGLVRCPICCD
ncbi:hypothetical protein ACFE04_010580 [Oxalis oulophora]